MFCKSVNLQQFCGRAGFGPALVRSLTQGRCSTGLPHMYSTYCCQI